MDCCRSPAQGPGYRLQRDRNGIISGLAYQDGTAAGPEAVGEVSDVAGDGDGNLMKRLFGPISLDKDTFDSSETMAAAADFEPVLSSSERKKATFIMLGLTHK